MVPERHSLARVIGRDLFRWHRSFDFISGNYYQCCFLVTTAHETRLLTAAKDKLYEEKTCYYRMA